MGPRVVGWARSDQGENEVNDNRNAVKAGMNEVNGLEME